MDLLLPTSGIYLTMKALLQPGQHVVVMFPAYQSLFELAGSIGCQLDLWEPHALPDGRLEYRVQDVLVSLLPAGQNNSFLGLTSLLAPARAENGLHEGW